ncbi:hypothetical protein AD998_02100 [bacterium 336/3]|nr:hypothetical protein AD998_02100 [bacterium 336/3]
MENKIQSILEKITLINTQRKEEGKKPYTLNPTLSEKEIIDFEKKYQIQLPEEYKAFLLHIGNGNQEEYHRHINSLEESVRYHYTDTTTLPIHLPFPFTQIMGIEIIEDNIYRFYPAEKVRNILDSSQKGDLQGCLILNYEGWGSSHTALVVTGESKGFVWHVEDMYHPFYTQKGKKIICYTFLDWLSYNLDMELSVSNLKLIQDKQYAKVINLDLSGESQTWREEIHFEEIFKCSNLESLTLSRNYRIQELPTQIGNLQNLNTFKMNGGSLKQLPKEFCDLKNLEVLELSYQSLQKLPKDIGQLQALKKVSLYWNSSLRRLPKSFSKLKNLTYLSLGHCEKLNLSQTLPIIGELPHIKSLSLETAIIPREIIFLKNIEDLSIRKLYGEQSVEISHYLQYLTHLKSLHLNECGLKEVPDWISKLKNLEVLSLGQNPFKTLPKSIGELSNLRYLSLENTKIKRLPKTLIKLQKLEEIELRYVPNIQLQNIFEIIGKLPKMKTVHSISIATKFPSKIEEVPYLEELVIDSDYRRKQVVPDSISNISNLSFLRLAFSSHLKLSEEFTKLSKLEIIRIEAKKLLLPENFGELQNLKELQISKCNLEHLPKTFDKLKNLETLYLEGNFHLDLKDTLKKLSKLPKLRFLRITAKELPAEIGLCTQLEKLEIYNSSQYKHYRVPLILPNEIGNLIHLKHLDLEENHLTSIPKSIGNLKALCYLALNENKLRELPVEICNLENLQELYLFKNRLRELPKEFDKLKNLHYLDISENQLESIPQKLHSLKHFIY